MNIGNARDAPYDIRIQRDPRRRDWIDVEGEGAMDVQDDNGQHRQEIVRVKLKVHDTSDTDWGTRQLPRSIPWESPDRALPMDVPEAHAQIGDLAQLNFDPDRTRFVRRDFAQWVLRYSGAPTMLHTGQNMQLGFVTLLQGERLGLEKHDASIQMFYDLRGLGHIYAGDGSTAPMMDGMATIVPAGRYHDVANFNVQPLYLPTIYTPAAHPNATGVYANKTKRADYTAPRVKEREGLDPIQHALISLAPFAHQGERISSKKHTIARQDNLHICAIAIGVRCMRLLQDEGYYYVVGGRLHLEQMQAHAFVRTDTLEPGALFYVAPHTITKCVADGDTRAHLIGFMVDSADAEGMSKHEALVADVGEDTARELERQAQRLEQEPANGVERTVPESRFETLADVAMNAEIPEPPPMGAFSTPVRGGPRDSLSSLALRERSESLRHVAESPETPNTRETRDGLEGALRSAILGLRALSSDSEQPDDDDDDW